MLRTIERRNIIDLKYFLRNRLMGHVHLRLYGDERDALQPERHAIREIPVYE